MAANCALAVALHISFVNSTRLVAVNRDDSFTPLFRGAPSIPIAALVDDLSAQLAPLDMYGLAGLGCAVFDGLTALAGASSKGLRALGRARPRDSQPACGTPRSVGDCRRPV